MHYWQKVAAHTSKVVAEQHATERAEQQTPSATQYVTPAWAVEASKEMLALLERQEGQEMEVRPQEEQRDVQPSV